MTARTPSDALRHVRKICLGLPETNERLSHGAPTFFIRDKKTFVMFLNNHHDDGRLALWCAAPSGMQQTLFASSPKHYFVPPYVGHRGWIGVRLDKGIGWDEVAGVIEDAFVTVAPKTVLRDAGLT